MMVAQGNPSLEGRERRKAALDLPSLERDCMRALWPLREATVKQIQLALAGRRPRAYTTVMTIMDRLAHKGVVTRRKSGRAWMYAPSVSANQARAFALGQLVENFFDGSAESLQAFLVSGEAAAPPVEVAPAPRVTLERQAKQKDLSGRSRMDETLL